MRNRIGGLFAIGGVGCLFMLIVTIVTVAGYIHHLVYCFQTHQWIRLLVLAILAPLGVVDGWGLWFGWWN